MKQLTQILSTLLVAVLLLNSCKKDTDNNDETKNPTPDEIKGKVILPAGSSIDANSLTVLSTTAESMVENEEFEIEVFGDYTALYATNASDEVILIGYKYPNSPDNDISATSTAIGLLMISPTVLDLSEQGKQTLIENIKNDNNFNTLVNEIEQTALQGISLFDTTNATLVSALVNLFQSASFKKAANAVELPVNMFKAGRNFTFNNNGKAYSTVIGIYKENIQLDKIIVDGIQIVPNSISDLLAGNGGYIGNPVDKSYTLDGDGDFTFKLRTGKPGFGDGSAEHDEAFFKNLSDFSYNFLLTIAPFLKNSSCLVALRNKIFETIISVQGLSSNTNASTGEVLEEVVNILLGSISTLLEGCINPNPDWFTSFLGQWNFIHTAFGAISNGANTTIFAAQWALSEAVVDTCFNAVGNTVNPGECGDCSGGDTTFTDNRDGEVYKIVQIGNQCWFAENLRYTNSISNVSSNNAWNDIQNIDPITTIPNPTEQPAWCYYNNDPSNESTHGVLYNWYAIDRRSVCPSGWHVPSNAEWTELINYLGVSVAGSKIKDTSNSDWNPCCVDTIDNSGFLGLASGSRHSGGTFGDMGRLTNWWSSTESSDLAAFEYALSNYSVEVSTAAILKTNGYSCRCLRD